jgi:HEAT repeat protein
VRVAAARGLAALRYPPARSKLEQLLESRVIRGTDLTEKIAFFEACAAVGGAASIPLFDRILNGRRLLGKEAPEMRACAAMALGRVGTPDARAALQRASAETNPVIRNAVVKALRLEAS